MLWVGGIISLVTTRKGFIGFEETKDDYVVDLYFSKVYEGLSASRNILFEDYVLVDGFLFKGT